MDLIEIRATDFCCFESFTLPLRGQGLVWVTGENRDTKAADNNGSGKSTLFKAITWGLYGQTIDGERGDKIIRSGQTAARVEVELGDGEKRWVVVRERRKGLPKLQLIQPDGQPFEAGKDAIQEKITEMVGLDFSAFKNTVLYGQNDSARFANPRTRDSERKEMLHRILRTGVLAHCHDWALERRRALRSRAVVIEADIAAATGKLGMLDVQGLQLDFETYEGQRKHDVKTAQEEARQHKADAGRHLEFAPAASAPVDGKRLGVDIKRARAALVSAQSSAELAAELAADIGAKAEHRVELRSLLAQHDAAIGVRSDTLAQWKGKRRCPTCNSPLDKGEARRHHASIEGELVACRADRTGPQIELQLLEDGLEHLRAEKAHADAAASKGPAIARAIKELESQQAALEMEDVVAKAAIEAARQRARQSLELARSAILRARAAKGQPNPHKERLHKAKIESRTLKMERKAARLEQVEVAAEAAHVEFWVRGFSHQGLPSYILDSVMPYVTIRANRYLETLADGDIQMNFSTQRELKSAKAEYRDEIDITWEVEGIADYPPSGGQLKKMEIATDLALMDLVATRAPAALDILALDEVLDGLDGEGRQRVLMLLGDLRARCGTVFVISHETEVAEIFEKSIVVVKQDGVASIQAVD